MKHRAAKSTRLAMSLLRRDALLQLSKPVQDYLDLRRGGSCGRGALAGGDNAEESLAVERDVVVSLDGWTAILRTTRHRHSVSEREGRPRRHAPPDPLSGCRTVEQFLPVGRPRRMDAISG